MANWSKPTLPDPYPDFLDSLVARDLDCGTLFLVDPTNPPTGVIRYNRSLNLFQEWNGSTWVNKVLAQAGGGTGAGSLPALGTMASQNANNVNISGGNMQGMTTVYANGELRSATHLRINGQIVNGSSQIVLTDAVGKIPSITSGYFSNLDGQQINNINGSNIATGIVYRDRLGTGATGSGAKVLLDNGTWIDKYQVGAGMVEIVHGTFPTTGAQSYSITISWTGAQPSSDKKVSIRINGQVPVNNRYWISAPNQFQFYMYSQQSGLNVDWTAFHHATQV